MIIFSISFFNYQKNKRYFHYLVFSAKTTVVLRFNLIELLAARKRRWSKTQKGKKTQRRKDEKAER